MQITDTKNNINNTDIKVKVANEMLKVIKGQGSSVHQLSNSFCDVSEAVCEVIDILKSLIKFQLFIAFLVCILWWKIFAFSALNKILGDLFIWWSQLSENWQIAIFMLIGSVPLGIITIIISNYINKKFEKNKI